MGQTDRCNFSRQIFFHLNAKLFSKQNLLLLKKFFYIKKCLFLQLFRKLLYKMSRGYTYLESSFKRGVVGGGRRFKLSVALTDLQDYKFN